MNDNKKVKIILVEDDLSHAKLIIKNLKRAGVNNELIHLDNGKKVIDYFDNNYQSDYYYLILLDLNLPILNGYEVIKKIRSSSATKNIPIIVLTTTDNPEEIELCYSLGANLYLTKPIVYTDFVDAIKKLGFMLSIVKLPFIYKEGKHEQQ